MREVMLQKCHVIIIVISSLKLSKALPKCQETTKSTYGWYMAGHVISTSTVSDLSECVIRCSNEVYCKSLNYLLKDKSCELNNADRHTHPKDYTLKDRSVYMDTSKRHRKDAGYESCAEIHQELPQARSGYYWLKVGNRDAQVFCDMANYGGGWTLVVSVSSKNNDHLQRPANNCLNSVLCVPFIDKNVTVRKLSDQEIHKLARTEGTFRVDVSNTLVTVFYQIPSGANNFNSSCGYGQCPRIITSQHYPYHWETNPCTTIDVGYRIYNWCHRVFDGHDDAECNNTEWWSSGMLAGKRALYGLPCPESPQHHSQGISWYSDGMLYVK